MMKLIALCTALASATLGCGDQGANAPRQPVARTSASHGNSTSGPHGPASATPTGASGLCVQPHEIADEPLDLEALDAETSASDVPAAVTHRLAQLVASGAEHGSVMSASADATPGDLVVALAHCAAQTCQAGLLTLGRDGADRRMTALPGTSQTRRERLQPDTARVDIDGDGRRDLWVTYNAGDADIGPVRRHLAVFKLPGLQLTWHGEVAATGPRPNSPGCDGAVYFTDANCDGDGDLVLIKRCAPMRCLNDDGEGCAPVAEHANVFLWHAQTGQYRPRS